MIDSSKKQQQGFPEILPTGDIEPLKEKECLELNNQKSLKEGQSLAGWWGEDARQKKCRQNVNTFSLQLPALKYRAPGCFFACIQILSSIFKSFKKQIHYYYFIMVVPTEQSWVMNTNRNQFIEKS